MADWVFDASAVLAFLLREPGGEIVEKQMDGGAMTSVNLAEVVSRLVDTGLSPEAAEETASELQCEIVPVDAFLGVRAGMFRHTTRRFGLSLGDRICLAYAERVRLPVLTSDRAWAKLDLGVDVRLIR